MGACSSKPKTTEFEGSMEPLRKTEDVSADRSIDTHVDAAQVSKHSLQNLTDEPGKEFPVKLEGGGANESAEVMQEKFEPIIGSEEPLKVDLSSTAKGNGVTLKDGVGDKEGANDKASLVGEDVGGHFADGDNICEDKAIVLNEVGDGIIDKGDVYTDKAVALDEEKVHESLDKGCVSTHDNKSSKAQDVSASAGGESPIIGVVQPVEPIPVDDMSEKVRMATADTTGSDDSTPLTVVEKVDYSLDEIEKEVSAGTRIIVAAKKDTDVSSDLPRGAENAEMSGSTIDDVRLVEDEDLQEGTKVSPYVSEYEVVQENGTNVACGVDPQLETAELQDEICVKGTTRSDTTPPEPQEEVEECTSELPHGETGFDTRSTEKLHVEVMEPEGNAQTVDKFEVCASNSLGDTDAEISDIPKVEAAPEEAVKDKVEVTPEEVVEEKVEVTPEAIVDEADVQPQVLAVEGSAEKGKLEGTSDEAIAEPSADTEANDNVEELQAVKATLAKAKVDIASREGELAFEDVLDVPLKVESSNAESGPGLTSS